MGWGHCGEAQEGHSVFDVTDRLYINDCVPRSPL